MLQRLTKSTFLAIAVSLPFLVQADDFVEEFPSSCDQAVAIIVDNIDDESRQKLMDVELEQLQQFNRGWGNGIRESFGLNTGNFELMESCLALRPDMEMHPVNVSRVIMEEVWKEVHQVKSE